MVFDRFQGWFGGDFGAPVLMIFANAGIEEIFAQVPVKFLSHARVQHSPKNIKNAREKFKHTRIILETIGKHVGVQYGSLTRSICNPNFIT